MPLINPNKNESEIEFIRRFMNDPKMKEEYSDYKQRLAIAFDMYRRNK